MYCPTCKKDVPVHSLTSWIDKSTPLTNRHCIYCGHNFNTHVVGLPVPRRENENT